MKKTILITGSSSGIGKAVAKHFAANDWNVIATMRSPEKETDLTQLANVLVTRLDVQDKASMHQAIQAGLQRFGKIDALLNNAGFGVFGAIELATSEQIRQQFEVNVFGVMEMTQAVLPHFRENKAGTILNVSSMGGQVAFGLGTLYHASKFAIEGFSESLTYELAPLGITVKLVEPGVIVTGFNESMNLVSQPGNAAYDEFTKAYFEHWGTLHPVPTTVEAVAEVVFAAATDGTAQFRYVAGKEAKAYINVRQTKDDQAYMRWMKNKFMPAAYAEARP
ncbi:SDR family oxidoreductase [uncultured Hymenobacter sp.]|uniref:SDR family oxidoreductase n=1 Tax=uncultured Hymenobacter sp. TaxID=170016 RepID=UPI0035CBE1FE